jgi:uncharacterized protein YsxB (DUF464 family)
MIHVAGWTDQDDHMVRLRVTGHAGSGSYGEDTVCAAVSALVETLRLGFERQASASRCVVDEGSAEFWINPERDPAAEIAVAWVARGLQDLADSHHQFVRWRLHDHEGAAQS